MLDHDTTTFTDNVAPLRPGTYQLEVSSSIVAFQPSAKDLGPNYSNFTGPLLKRGSLGMGIRYESTLVIPGQTDSKADAAARRTAELEKADWIKKFCAELPAITERYTGKTMPPSERDAATAACLNGK